MKKKHHLQVRSKEEIERTRTKEKEITKEKKSNLLTTLARQHGHDQDTTTQHATLANQKIQLNKHLP